MNGLLTLDEIRAVRPDLAKMVDVGELALADASVMAEDRHHEATYSPRDEWSPTTDNGSGLQRMTDYRPLTDFKAIRRWVLDRDKHICHYCKAAATEVDHLWPRRYGGADHINNLVAACRKCNGSKGATVDLSTTRAALIKCGLDAIIARLGSEIDELERWARAYVDTCDKDPISNFGSTLFGVAMDVGDPLIELGAVKRSLQAAADRAMTDRRSEA